MKEARRRWEITKHWREAEGVNGILNEPQPFYHLMYVEKLSWKKDVLLCGFCNP